MANVEQVAQSLQKAMKGFGTDNKRLIKEIVGINNATRQQVKEKYLSLYGRTLEDEIKSEIDDEFLKGILALLEQSDIYEAKNIHDAIDGAGTNEKVIIQTLLSKDANEVAKLREVYNRLYNNQFDQDISKEEKGTLGLIFKTVASGNRSTATDVDQELANQDAQTLYNSVEAETDYVNILCARSFPQLRATFDAFSKMAGNDIETAIKKEFIAKLNLRFALLAIVRSARNRAAYFAKEIHYAMDGPGTRDDDLIRLLVTRSETDMKEIKQHYQSFYGKSLYDELKSEMGGFYETLFLTLIGQ